VRHVGFGSENVTQHKIASVTSRVKLENACPIADKPIPAVQGSVYVKSLNAGCLQLPEIFWNLKTLLEISLNVYGPPRSFCVKCYDRLHRFPDTGSLI